MIHPKDELRNLLFLDIETVSSKAKFDELDEGWQELWHKKAQRIDESKPENELYSERAAIFSEFGKIVVIGMGYLHAPEREDFSFRIKALAADDEFSLLSEFCEVIQKIVDKKPKVRFVAHNGIEFDYPYLCRRILANGLALPKPLQLMGKKPWEVPHYDTLELWKFGDRKNYTSLELIAKVFGLPTSKHTIDGSHVGHYYHNLNDLETIASYCLDDVILTARVFLKMTGSNLELSDSKIVKS